MEDIKLLIAIPALDMMHSRFVSCLVRLIDRLCAAGIEHETMIPNRTQVYRARELLAEHAVENGFTHVLWLDSDMTFEPDLAERLLASKKDFITGIYHKRRPGYGSCVLVVEHGKFEALPSGASGIVKADACGFGCVITSAAMLKRVRDHYRYPFTPSDRSGEDVQFCRRARETGFELWCDTSIRCGHMGIITVTPDNTEKLAEAVKDYS